MSAVVDTAFPTKRLKHVVALRRLRSVADARTGPYVGLEDIQPGTGRLVKDVTVHDRFTSPADEQDMRLSTGFERGDVLFGKLRPYLAKAWLAEFPGRCTTEALVMEPVEIEPRFLRSVCLSPWFVGAVDASTFGSKMPRAEWDFIGNIPVPLPNLKMQNAIADYVGQETVRLDTLIAAKERLLQLLVEKRIAVINRAITCGPELAGLTNELSQRKLKYVAKFSYGDSLPDNARQGGDFRVFGSNGPFADSTIANTGSPAIVVGRKGSYGKVSWSSDRCFASDTTFFVDGSTCEHDLRWLYWALQTLQLDEGTDEAAVPGLNREAAHDRKIGVPPRPAQRDIADYIDRETGRLDALSAKVEKTAKLLRERRSAIISAAVTGKITIGSANEGIKVSAANLHDFWSSPTLSELAKAQNVGPLDTAALRGTWPGEDNDGFEEAIDELRHGELRGRSDSAGEDGAGEQTK